MNKNYVITCCKDPECYDAYVPCYPFRGRFCKSCGNVSLTCNWFWSLLFKYFFSYLWNGTVKVIGYHDNFKTLEQLQKQRSDVLENLLETLLQKKAINSNYTDYVNEQLDISADLRDQIERKIK